MKSWEKTVKAEIKYYATAGSREAVLREQLKEVEAELFKVKSLNPEQSVASGSGKSDDRICALLDRKMALESRIAAGKHRYKMIDICLTAFDSDERKILLTMCTAEYGDNIAGELAEELHIEESTVRRRWHRLMRKYKELKDSTK